MSKLDCLIDWVGLDNCITTSTPPSGRYINELPGIEVMKLDQIANQDLSGFQDVWNRAQNRAASRFSNDMRREFSKRFKKRDAVEFMSMVGNLDLNSLTNPKPNISGHTIELDWQDCTIANSNYSAIQISTISFYAPSAGSYPIVILDLDTGLQIASYTITATGAGWISKIVNSTFNIRRIFIGIDQSALQLYEYNIDKQWMLQTNQCGTARVKGATVALADISNYQGIPALLGSNTYGFSTKFSVVCIWDNLVCNHPEYWTDAWMYACAIELMNELMFTSRLNRFTTTDLNQQKKAMAYYNMMYNGGQDELGQTFDGYLYSAIDSLTLDCHDSCFLCNDLVTFRTALL